MKNKKTASPHVYLVQKNNQPPPIFRKIQNLLQNLAPTRLVILGTRASIEKVEDFILNYVDTELQQPYSPLYVYDLQYANSDNVAQILNQVTAFAPNSKAAAMVAFVMAINIFRPMQFISEPSGNRLLIRAEKEDYLKVRTIIEQLDVKQPQIAIEVLVVNVNTTKLKSLRHPNAHKNTRIWWQCWHTQCGISKFWHYRMVMWPAL